MSSSFEYYCPPDLYDVIHSDITLDIPFWIEQAGATSGAILELCCGTGRLLVPCAEAGARIEGLDLSAAMVEACRAKLAGRGLAAEVGVGDMRRFSRPHRFQLIFIACNSFQHNETGAQQNATLRCCREHLEPGGRLMITLFHPSPQRLAQLDGTERELKRVPHPRRGGTVRLLDAGRYDRAEQRASFTRTVEWLDPAGVPLERGERSFELRYIHKPEMERLMRAAGFGRYESSPGVDGQGRQEDGELLVWTAWND